MIVIFSDDVVEIKFLLLCLDRYLSVWLVALDTYPEVTNKMYFCYYYWEPNYIQIGSASSNCTICGFCHDSLIHIQLGKTLLNHNLQWRIYIVKFWTRPPGVQIFSISCSFWENLAKSYVGAPPGELVPPPRGNPGSATDLIHCH